MSGSFSKPTGYVFSKENRVDFTFYARIYSGMEVLISFISALKATLAGNDGWASLISGRWAEKHRYRITVHGEESFKKTKI